ncbi:MAG: tetratricopeptide repeat protein [Methylotetracoccus sp.]
MLRALVFGLFIFASILEGCGGLFATTHDPEWGEFSDVQTRRAAPSPEAEYVYLILSAELAGQAGQYAVALENYMKVARISRDPRIAERATQIALFAKDGERALEAATLWGQRDPKNIAPKRVAAVLNLKEGHIDRGVEQLRALLHLPGIDLEATLGDLVKMLNAEVSKEQALETMQRLERAMPSSAEVHFAYALLASDKGEYPLASEQVQKALALQPRMARAQLLQAQLMSQKGDSAAARDGIKKALQNDPNNVRLRLVYAQFLTKTGDLQGAERELHQVIKREPDNEDARFGLAVLLLETEQLDRAEAEFQRLAGSTKWRGQAAFYLGLLEARKGRLEAALRWFDQVESGPTEFDARVNAVTALINLDRLGEARSRLVELRRKFPNEALKLYLLESDLLVRRHDPEAAFDLLTAALKDMPQQSELLYSRALVAERLGRLDVLESDLRAVLAKTPDDANALNALGFTLADHGIRLDEAQALIERAMKLKPDDAAILDSWGWLQYRRRNLEQSVVYLQRAYRLVDDPEIGAHLGEVLWELGRRDEARQVWRSALKRDPNHHQMKRIREKYREAFPL